MTTPVPGESAPEQNIHVDVHQPRKRNSLAAYTILLGLAVLLALGSVVVWSLHEQGIQQDQIKANAHSIQIQAKRNAQQIKDNQRLNNHKWCALVTFSLHNPVRPMPGQTMAQARQGRRLVVQLARNFDCPLPPGVDLGQ